MRNLPKTNLAFLPTPVEYLPNLSKLLNQEIWIKRDDQTGLFFGGNKTRKLEYLVGQAEQQNAKTLITAGAIQSNHCRQTAAAATKCGFDCVLVLGGDSEEESEGNRFLDELLGASIIWTDWDKISEQLEASYEELKKEGKNPFFIPYGGSNPIGAIGYVNAIAELQKQEIEPDWIVFASSSGGTQAGLVVGKAIFNVDTKVLGISVEPESAILKDDVAKLATETASLLGFEKQWMPEEIIVNDDYLGEGYARMGEFEKKAIQLLARTEGIVVDPVYTGRAFAGMVDLIKNDYFGKEDRILFWHTGGSPALFVKQYMNRFE